MNRRQFAALVGEIGIPSLAALPAHASAQEDCGIPSSRPDGWTVISSDERGLVSRAALCESTRKMVVAAANIHSVVAVRGGKIVFEQYFKGPDEVPGYLFGRRVQNVAFDADTLHDMKSVSKSVASLAVGIAIDQGLIHSVDEPVFSFFPEFSNLRTPEKDRILLRHALTMTMGLDWVEATPATGNFANDEARMYMSLNPCRYVLGLPVAAPAGQKFHYNTGALALISAIVRKATGRPLDEFARVHLFEPLGIVGGEWRRVFGDTDAGGGLRLRPREMAKIGQLVLAGGRWNGRQVVSRGWVEESTTEKIQATDEENYAYLWWLGRARAKRHVVRWIGAQGRGGQSIRIVPELDLVVAVTAGYYQDYSQQAFQTQYRVFTEVLKAVSDPA